MENFFDRGAQVRHLAAGFVRLDFVLEILQLGGHVPKGLSGVCRISPDLFFDLMKARKEALHRERALLAFLSLVGLFQAGEDSGKLRPPFCASSKLSVAACKGFGSSTPVRGVLLRHTVV